MSLTERDPTDICYAALCVAIIWYHPITPEQAKRIVERKSSSKPGVKLTPELKERIKKVTDSPNFKNFNTIEKRFKINKYDIKGEIDLSPRLKILFQKMKDIQKDIIEEAGKCSAEMCEVCPGDNVLINDLTFCDVLCDIDPENLQKADNRRTHKCTQLYTEIMKGETEGKTYRIYKPIRIAFDEYMKKHPEKKQQDEASRALYEYLERHK